MKNSFALLMVVCLALPALGTDRLVPSQYSTIQSAIDAAMAGDTIIISPGIYSGNSNSNLHIYSGRPVIIRSIEPTNPEIVAATIIDCFDVVGGYNPAFTLDSGGSVIIDGLTIINGYNYQGGGIMFRSAFASLRNCVFEECMAWGEGGGIYSENSIIMLSDCIFRNSYSDTYGGAVRSKNSKIEMHNCTIEGGFARNSGGAIYSSDNSDILLVDSIFNDNWSQSNGGALSVYNSKLSIKGCEFIGNTALGSRTSLIGGAVHIENSTLSTNTFLVADSNFMDNFSSGSGGGIYCKNQPLTATRNYFIGNISQQSGGGIYCGDGMELTNSVLSGNSASDGAAIQCTNQSQSNIAIKNCTFADNRSTSKYFIRISGGNSTEILNSIFWGLSEQSFSIECCQTVLFAYNDVEDGKFPPQAGVGNIQLDPMFVKSGVWSTNSYIPGDYRVDLESLIVNAGDPNTVLAADDQIDIDGNPRQRLGRIDMGAYETASHPMDLDQNGIVNFADFRKMAEAWLWEAAWHK